MLLQVTSRVRCAYVLVLVSVLPCYLLLLCAARDISAAAVKLFSIKDKINV